MAGLEHLDQEILADFTTEAAELIESLDRNLVQLEQTPDDAELINASFRAIHTIKGSGGFLALTPITSLAHVAEDALNTLRHAGAVLTADMMDLLLKAADVLRAQIDQLREGRMPDEADQPLIQALRRVGEEGSQRKQKRDTGSVDDAVPAVKQQPQTLELPQAKLDLLEFMVDDLRASLREAGELLEQLRHCEGDDRRVPLARLRDMTGELSRMVEFFEIDAMVREVAALARFAAEIENVQASARPAAYIPAEALLGVLSRRAEALTQRQLLDEPSPALIEQLAAALEGRSDVAPSAPASATTTPSSAPAANTTSGGGTPSGSAATSGGGSAEQTIRVSVDRLESMLNLVGELVLQKNRVLAMNRTLARTGIAHELHEQFEQITSDLNRITADLQVGVMKTRLQPLSKVFGRYPRIVRDLERATGKKIELKIDGGQTEVDRTVLEHIGDPLVHILRNSADHGLEPPEQRTASGKSEAGLIHILARHEGSHVLIRVNDDGRGIDPQVIGKLAVERGLITPDQRQSMSDHQIIQLIFAPGFSTAQQVSQISGRGVGMDVVRSNVAMLNGTIDLDSTPGKGTSVSIRLPLTLAIMPAMILRVAGDLMAVPLANTLEIIRMADAQADTVQHQPVLRWRDQVIPLLDLASLFEMPRRDSNAPGQFAVVIGQGDRQVALRIDEPIGQQEVVIKPLDRSTGRCPAIGSATVREDGGVSLILDAAGLFEMIRKPLAQAA